MEKFAVIVKDFINDLNITFPELKDSFQDVSLNVIHNHCLEVYPNHFFDILYEREQLFDEQLYLLPNIDFNILMNDKNISEKTKKIIWKYLQLILFYTMEQNDKININDTTNDISMCDINTKISETMENMKNFFSEQDLSENLIDTDKMRDKIETMMSGKIGSLAKEIAEETTKNMDNPEEFFNDMLKNPQNIMGLVKSIGDKLNDKMGDGVEQGEMLKEATNIMTQMGDIPGLKEMMDKMNIPGKMDMKGMMNKMEQMTKQEKTKERMRNKMEQKKLEKEVEKEVIKKLMDNKQLNQDEHGNFVFREEDTKVERSKRRKRKNKPKL